MIIQLVDLNPAINACWAMGYRARRYRSTWPTFPLIEIVPGVAAHSVAGDDETQLWMPDSLSDRLRPIGVRAVAASGVVLPETVPRDGTDAYEGSIRRAFLVGLARDLRRGGLGVDEIVDAMRLRYAGLPDWEIFNAVRA